MDRQDYNMKIQMLLDTDHYKKLNKDPNTKVEKQTRDAIKESSIPKEEQRRLLPSENLPPRLYGLSKIHKPNNPLRPIVSTCRSPTYELAKYVAKQLAQYSGNTKSFVKLPMERRILRASEWCRNWISSITCNRQHLYGSIRTGSHRI
ncbi:hypothetical protein Trydic_g16341 [Trypoxylus dichotomus]